MPDGTLVTPAIAAYASQRLEHINRWVRPFWEHRLILVACALFAFGFTASQTAEFMDNALLSCLPFSDCSAAGSRRLGAAQFIGLMVTCACFGLLLWRLGDRSMPTAGGPEPTRPETLAGWVPGLAGGLCLVLACGVLIANTNAPSHSWPTVLWPTVSCLAGGACAYWFGKSAHRMRWQIAGLGMLSALLLALRPFDTSQEWANLFVPALPLVLMYFLLRPLSGWKERNLRAVLLWAVLPFLGLLACTALAAGSLAVYFNGQSRTWTFPFMLLVPAWYGMAVARCRLGRQVRPGQEAPPTPGSPSAAPLLWFLVGLFGLVALSGNLWPVKTSTVVAAPSALVAFIAVMLLLATAFVRIVPRPVRWFVILAYVMVIVLRGVPPAPLRSLSVQINAAACTEAPSICDSKAAVAHFLAAWEKRRPEAPEAPVLLVAAAGGGARAAAHTSAVLAAVDAATCGAFGDRLFAISGVSGGAVGGALYAASRQDLRTPQDWEDCKRLPAGERPSWLLPRLVQVSTGDHLSAPLLRTLFRDVPLSLLMLRRSPNGQAFDDFDSRAGALALAWKESYAQLHPQGAGHGTRSDSFSGNAAGPEGSAPLMIFNATSVQDGMRVLLNRASVCPVDSWCGGRTDSYLSMAMDSARFPLISPAKARNLYGWDQYSNRPMVTERAVVDGGYFDNTGVSTLLDVMDGLEAAKVARGRIYAILITSDPQEGRTPDSLPDFSDQGALSQLLGPVSTVVQTRGGRSRLAVHELQRRLGACNVLYWSMSNQTLNPLTEEMLKVLKSDPEGDALAALHGGPQVMREREPALGWALSERSGNRLEIFARARALPFEFGEFAHANDRKLAIGLGVPVKPTQGGAQVCPLTPTIR